MHCKGALFTLLYMIWHSLAMLVTQKQGNLLLHVIKQRADQHFQMWCNLLAFVIDFKS